MFDQQILDEKQKKELIPNCTCPVCGKFNETLLNNLSRDLPVGFETIKQFGQYFCCTKHKDKHCGKSDNISVSGLNDPIFIWGQRS